MIPAMIKKSWQRRPYACALVLGLVGLIGTAALVMALRGHAGWRVGPHYKPRKGRDFSGFGVVRAYVRPYKPGASLEEIRKAWTGIGFQLAKQMDSLAADQPAQRKIDLLLKKAALMNYEGQSKTAYEILEQTRTWVEGDGDLAREWLYTIIFYQGVAGLRRGEDDNCVLCRGESSCILPISPAAVHTDQAGSRIAIKHFSEYLERFPDDLEARWLLNLAYMTLGEYPHQVDPRFLVSLDHFEKSEFDIGKFRDIAHLAGVNHFNQAGGAIMEDFHNRGVLDIAITSMFPAENMTLFRNKGDGTFEDVTAKAGLVGQVGGGLSCVQTDYNNDGNMDIFIPRGAWLHAKHATRPSLLRNNGNGTFTDVTLEAGLGRPMNANAVGWADIDNDGFLDLFVCGEKQPSRLYRNKGDGTFEDFTARAGLLTEVRECRGCTWIDFDNDDYPDLFLNLWDQQARLYRNNGDGTFTDVSRAMGIDGPGRGFSCWAFDYDNDGWLDLFATCSDSTLRDAVLGLEGRPHSCATSKLYRNLQGKGFQDVTREAGLDGVYLTMGSNFGDFDNDGYLDLYLGTGGPDLALLVPNRMFKNVAGQRFAEITASSRTGHLQKGHGCACGDWRRSGSIDIFMEMGGASNGDRYHNVLFLNPGQGNNWLNVKLRGKKTSRAALGARIKVVTAGADPLTVHRHVSSGSSFGANPLEQHVGLGKATKVALLEVYWPTSRTRQVFRNLDVNQAVEVTELASTYRKLPWKTIPTPK